MELLGVLPEHARSDLPAVIAAVRPGSGDPRHSSPTSSVEVAVDAIAPDEPPDPAVGASHPAVAPGGDVEAWALLDEVGPTPGESPGLHVIPGLATPRPTSALDGVRDGLAALHRDGVAAAAAPPPDGDLFEAAIQAGRADPADTPDLLAAALPATATPSQGEAERFADAIQAGRTSDGTPAVEVAAELLEQASPPPPAAPTDPGVELPNEVAPLLAGPTPSAAEVPMVATPAAGVDDFGPLLDPPPGRRRRRSGPPTQTTQPPPKQPTRPRSRRWVAACAAAAVVALLAALLVNWFSSAQTPEPVAALTWRDWHGISLPVSPAAGPAVWEGDQASGFDRSPLGAAIAAAHLSVRVDPAVGEQVWGPVLASQVVGDRDRLAAALADQAPPSGTEPGQPGQLTGWRIEGDPTAEGVVAHLAVRAADGTTVDYGIPLAWTTDWVLDVPSSGAVFSVSDTRGLYTAFTGVDRD